MVKSTKNLYSLSIVIPAYNEEDSLEWLVRDMIKDAPKFEINDLEIIIVNDGSTDKTYEIADNLSKKHKVVRVIHKKNGGYCSALLAGIKEAKKNYIAYFPADGQTLIRDIKKCIPLLGKADLILGDRGERLDYSLYRMFISHVYLILLRLLYGNPYRDINWFHIWKREKIQSMNLTSKGIFILAEIVIRFRKKNYLIKEASVPYRSRRSGEAKNAKLSIAWQTLVDLLRFWTKIHLLNFNKRSQI